MYDQNPDINKPVFQLANAFLSISSMTEKKL